MTRRWPAAARRDATQDYQAKISGPLFDRIDLHVDVPAVTPADLSLPPPAEGSAEVAARVARCREIQLARYAALSEDIRTNAEADGAVLEKAATPDADGQNSSPTRSTVSSSRHAAITGYCAWQAPWPTSKGWRALAGCISPRRCPTAASR